MSETVWLLAAGYRHDVPFFKAKTARLARYVDRLPGLLHVLWLQEPNRLNLLMFGTEQHAWKAQEALQYRSLTVGNVILKLKNHWGIGKRVFRGELDQEASVLRVMEPAEGWDSVPESERPAGLPWPPPADKPIEVFHFREGRIPIV